MTNRAASRRDHQRFCQTEGWTEVRNSRGKPTGHHVTYELVLADASVLRTRISRPANTDTYGKGLWSHIPDDQLHVSVDEFWECVDNGNPPRRTAASRENDTVSLPARSLPASLAYQLVNTLHLTTEEIAGISREQAVRLMTEHWGKPDA